jgi:hypothetical protein
MSQEHSVVRRLIYLETYEKENNSWSGVKVQFKATIKARNWRVGGLVGSCVGGLVGGMPERNWHWVHMGFFPPEPIVVF